MAAAYATLEHRAIPRATTQINIIQRVGGSVGTALLAVWLEREIRDSVGGAGHGLGAIGAIQPGVRVQLAAPLAHGFANTFWLSLFLAAAAYVPAFLLPRSAHAGAAGAGAGIPVRRE
ncbi:MAG TPA: hypothetical protein VFJ77_08825 [Gaiellaceae bacterium]|nr:hypothetical protein [Gaiellaceae bacterium]